MKQTIDTYKLTGYEEPSDELLAELMHEVALDVKQENDEATRRFFDRLIAEAKQVSFSTAP